MVFWRVDSSKDVGREGDQRTPCYPPFPQVRGLGTSVCLIPQAGLTSPAPSLPIGARGERYRAGHEGWGHSHAVMCVRGQGSASQV